MSKKLIDLLKQNGIPASYATMNEAGCAARFENLSSAELCQTAFKAMGLKETRVMQSFDEFIVTGKN